MADVYSFVSTFTACAKGMVQGRRRTYLMQLFSATESFKDVCLDVPDPPPENVFNNERLQGIADRFGKLTRVLPLPYGDAEPVFSAFLITWVA